MINRTMRDYDYFTFGSEDEYGQQVLNEEVQGTIKLAIYSVSNTIGTNINYKDATYVALTHNKSINDSYVIQYGEEKLKVLYTIPGDRFIQVFLSEM